MYELTHQVNIGRIFNPKEQDRQIAGNGVAPETGLPAVILDDDARIGAQRSIGIDHRAGEMSVELRVGLCGIDLPQKDIAVCPRQIEDPIRETPILVFLDQA
ncbi:MAG TPA: hypothetical protein VJZ49_11685 [Syntrophales bacterium]|nr:hypothetical protein [Syntrophales bacterium]